MALLIVPIYLLYSLVSHTNGTLDRSATAVCIGILLGFTLLFSAVLSLFTRARRHEILGAAAACVFRPVIKRDNELICCQILRSADCVFGQCPVLIDTRSRYGASLIELDTWQPFLKPKTRVEAYS